MNIYSLIYLNEVNNMPGYDKTGPEGKGPRTGRGAGSCAPGVEESNKENLYGLGRGGLPRGCGGGLGLNRNKRQVRPRNYFEEAKKN